MKYTYMDNNATTEMDPRVARAYIDASSVFGNASSMHGFGREAATLVQKAREQVALLIDADMQGIKFTSGGTEADNTVVSAARAMMDAGSKRNRIITTVIEHPAVLEPCKYLGKLGFKVDFVPVDATGTIRLDVLEQMLGDDVLLVSAMAANNETGTVQDVKQIATLAHAQGALIHTDAVQAVGKIPVSVRDWDVDFLSLSSHKFHGPKGIGALYIRPDLPIDPFMRGGHQEGGTRAGTYSTQSIHALGVAAEIARGEVDAEALRLWDLREKLRTGLERSIARTVVNGHQTACLPGTLNMSFAGAEGESILLMLDYHGIAVSTGSACATGSLEPSYVLLAGGLDIELAHGSIRFSLGRFSTSEDVDHVLATLPGIIARLREISIS